jgi:hypothetical protein
MIWRWAEKPDFRNAALKREKISGSKFSSTTPQSSHIESTEV